MKTVEVFRVRIVYKSGYTHDFDCLEFSVRGGEYSWTVFGNHKPLKLGADDIAAVWQLGSKKKVIWGGKVIPDLEPDIEVRQSPEDRLEFAKACLVLSKGMAKVRERLYVEAEHRYDDARQLVFDERITYLKALASYWILRLLTFNPFRHREPRIVTAPTPKPKRFS